MNENVERDLDSRDDEKWDSRELGADENHARLSSPERSAATDVAIDDALGLTPVTIRLQKELVQTLKMLARDQGLGYQPFVRQILTNYVKEREQIAKGATSR